ncbi:MAG: pilus assembly protein [Sphingomonadales bacterium]|nr:pilus assembly protein [Sphingomonadales bacterium]MDE2570415.1 pilus assembly protein [Sphingomonadales bacterium]
MKLLRDARGVAAIEFALTAPLVLTLMVGAMSIGQYYFTANALNHAVDEAARYATISPTPTDTQIEARFQSQDFGLIPASNVTFSSTTSAVSSSVNSISLTAHAQMTINFLFFRSGPIAINATRHVYASTLT